MFVDYLPAQRTLARAMAWLGLFAVGLGFPLALADAWELDRAHLLTAHLNGFVGLAWMAAVAFTMPMLRYGPAGQGRLAIGLVIGSFANVGFPAARAFWGFDGRGLTGDPGNDAAFVALHLLVTLPCTAAALAWVDGFRGQR